MIETTNEKLLLFREEETLLTLVEEFTLVLGSKLNQYRREVVEDLKTSKEGWQYWSASGYNAISQNMNGEINVIKGKSITDLLRKTDVLGYVFDDINLIWVDDKPELDYVTLIHEYLHAFENFFFPDHTSMGENKFNHGIKHSEIEAESHIIVRDRPDIPELLLSFAETPQEYLGAATTLNKHLTTLL